MANKLLLKKQYFRMEMSDGTTIEAHFKQMKELTDKLAVLGSPISEEDQVVTLLGSLLTSYQTLVIALESRDAVSLSYAQQSLIHEEKKLNGKYSSDSTFENGSYKIAALHGHKERERGPTASGKQQRRQWKPKCYSCGQKGHLQRDCPRKVMNNYSSTLQSRRRNLAGTPRRVR